METSGRVVTSATYFRLETRVVNTMVLERVTRRDLDTLFICQAANNNVSVPRSASVKIDILGETGAKLLVISRRYWKYQRTAATPHLS